jgi:hypothetical protein
MTNRPCLDSIVPRRLFVKNSDAHMTSLHEVLQWRDKGEGVDGNAPFPTAPSRVACLNTLSIIFKAPGQQQASIGLKYILASRAEITRNQFSLKCQSKADLTINN